MGFRRIRLFFLIIITVVFSGCFLPTYIQLLPEEVVEFLGVKPTESMLFTAVYRGYVSQVNFLLKFGLNVNAKTTLGYTPLHVAVLTGNKSMIKYLLENGADIRVIADDAETPYSLAAKKGDMELLMLILNSYLKKAPLERQPDITYRKPEPSEEILILPKKIKKVAQIPSKGLGVTFRLGIGNPYGIVGSNTEIGVDAFTVNLAYSPIGKSGLWGAGLRFYFPFNQNQTIRPRIGLFYGVIDLLSDDTPVSGRSYTVGLEYQRNSISFDADLVFSFASEEFPEYKNFPVLPSFGVGYRFMFK